MELYRTSTSVELSSLIKGRNRVLVSSVWCLSSRLIGKVNSEHGTCYVPLGESEVPNPSYEILVALSPSTAAPTASITTSITSTTTSTSPILVTNPLHKIYSLPTALPLTQDPGRTFNSIHDNFCFAKCFNMHLSTYYCHVSHSPTELAMHWLRVSHSASWLADNFIIPNK